MTEKNRKGTEQKKKTTTLQKIVTTYTSNKFVNKSTNSLKSWHFFLFCRGFSNFRVSGDGVNWKFSISYECMYINNNNVCI